MDRTESVKMSTMRIQAALIQAFCDSRELSKRSARAYFQAQAFTWSVPSSFTSTSNAPIVLLADASFCELVSHRRASRHLNHRQQLGDDVTDVRVWTRKHRLDGGPPGSHGRRKGGKVGQKIGTPDWRGALRLGHILEPDQSGPCLAGPVIQKRAAGSLIAL